MSRPPTAWEMADYRAAKSEAPGRFHVAFDMKLGAIEAGADLAGLTAAVDPVNEAAEIEALAAARRRASTRHPDGHACDACRIRRTLYATDPRGTR